MKRDMDLVRKILFAMEELETGFVKNGLTIEGYYQDEIGYHVFLMNQAGLLVGCETTHMQSRSPQAMPLYLTWEGYDFLEACRDEKRWIKSKDIIGKLGGTSFEVLKTILNEMVKYQATSFITGA